MKTLLSVFGIALYFIAPIFLIFPSDASAQTCTASSISSLKSCVGNINSYSTISITSNLTCSTNGDCCTSGNSLINLNGKSNKTILGNGHILKRTAGQYTCPALSANSSNNILIHDLDFDDDENSTPCIPGNGCGYVNVLQFHSSSNITLSYVGVFNGPGYAVVGHELDTFVIDHSVVVNSGVLGLYIGSTGYESENIEIVDSIFSRNRTNAIALQGVSGSSTSTNIIEDSVFDNNHHHGMFLQPNGLYFDGGQLNFPDADGITVSNNVIGNAICGNCENPAVYGFELAEVDAMSNVSITSNYFFNTFGVGFYVGIPSNLDSSVAITSNSLYGTSGLATGGHLSYASVSGNTVGDRTPTISHSGSADYNIYRLGSGGIHKEANVSNEGGGMWTLEDTFHLSMSPRPGASYATIYRCFASAVDDFASLDIDCEGHQLHSVLGFSYESTYTGAIPFYRCATGIEHFISWAANCEGYTNEGQLGYAVP